MCGPAGNLEHGGGTWEEVPCGATAALGRGRRAVGTIGADADVVRGPKAVPSRGRRWMWVAGGLVVWLLALAVAAVLGARSSGSPAGADPADAAPVPSAAQRSLLDEHGLPTVFLLTDGVDAPTSRLTVRFEWWSYPDVGLTVAFLDGEPIARSTVAPGPGGPAAGGPAAATDPTRLVHGMTASEVADLLGPSGPTMAVPTPAHPDHEVVVYPHDEVVVSYLDGVLVTAQTLRKVAP